MHRFTHPFRAAAVACALILPAIASAGDDAFTQIREEARASDAGYEMLTELCDRFGGRLAGTANTRDAMRWLAERLRAEGLDPVFEPFTMPAWERGDDELVMLAPVKRVMRALTIGYTAPCEPFEADVIDIGTGDEVGLSDTTARGKVGLLSPHTPVSRQELQRRAERLGLRAILRINREGGGQLLARTGGFQGEPGTIPNFSITQEEGFWMRRALERGQPVRVRVSVQSKPVTANTANLSVRFPGRSDATIVVAGHFDSWDRGQGAMDNGLGIAQLFEIARLLKKFSPENHHAIELVWLDGEEFGLWGSRARVKTDATRSIVAMINLDMVGAPTAVNALGSTELVPRLEKYRAALGEDALPGGVENVPWIASDHTPYMLAGIRSVTFNAPIPRESVRYYHDFADTIDKVDAAMLRQGNTAIATLVHFLANDATLEPRMLTDDEVIAIFKSKKLDVRLRQEGIWPFHDEPGIGESEEH